MREGKRTRTSDRDTAEAQACLDVEDIFDGVCGGKDDGISNEAVLVTLHGADHRGLRFCRLVVVNDTDASQELGNKCVEIRALN